MEHISIFTQFGHWLDDHGRNSAAVPVIREADGWLAEHRNTSLLWVESKDIRALLFTAAGPAQRDTLRDAIGLFRDFLIDKGWTDWNPVEEFGWRSLATEPWEAEPTPPLGVV